MLLKMNHVCGTGHSAFVPVGGGFEIGVRDPLLVHSGHGGWEEQGNQNNSVCGRHWEPSQGSAMRWLGHLRPDLGTFPPRSSPCMFPVEQSQPSFAWWIFLSE